MKDETRRDPKEGNPRVNDKKWIGDTLRAKLGGLPFLYLHASRLIYIIYLNPLNVYVEVLCIHREF